MLLHWIESRGLLAHCYYKLLCITANQPLLPASFVSALSYRLPKLTSRPSGCWPSCAAEFGAPFPPPKKNRGPESSTILTQMVRITELPLKLREAGRLLRIPTAERTSADQGNTPPVPHLQRCLSNLSSPLKIMFTFALRPLDSELPA